MESYSNAAFADQLAHIRRRQDRQNERQMMIRDSLNEVIEVLNTMGQFLDGHSMSRMEGPKIVKLTFAAKKLDYLDLTDGELGEAR